MKRRAVPSNKLASAKLAVNFADKPSGVENRNVKRQSAPTKPLAPLAIENQPTPNAINLFLNHAIMV